MDLLASTSDFLNQLAQVLKYSGSFIEESESRPKLSNVEEHVLDAESETVDVSGAGSNHQVLTKDLAADA